MAGEKWYRLFMKRYRISDLKEERQKSDELDEEKRAVTAPITVAKATKTAATAKQVTEKLSAKRGKEKASPSSQ